MGTVLHLGVDELPYADKGTISTGDVASILEDKYGVMAGFVFLHKEDIVEALADSAAGAIEALMQGAPPSLEPFSGGMEKVRELFQFQYLEKEEIVYTGAMGVPTGAALARRSLRFKGKKARKPRPSFIDTGLYEKSFEAWLKT